jgi:hypothetical protein
MFSKIIFVYSISNVENTCVDQGSNPIVWSQPKKWERRERREKREKMEKVKKERKNYVCDQTQLCGPGPHKSFSSNVAS